MGIFKRKKKNQDQKEYKISGDNIIRIIDHDGGCMATDRITVDGCDVGYMYRENSNRDGDTGWRFFSGDENEEYMSENTNHGVYQVNTIANYSPEIAEYIDTPAPCAFERVDGTRRFKIVEE